MFAKETHKKKEKLKNNNELNPIWSKTAYEMKKNNDFCL